jgi:regulator of protease activity HflC (stomatin/prohibitin superfamily)
MTAHDPNFHQRLSANPADILEAGRVVRTLLWLSLLLLPLILTCVVLGMPNMAGMVRLTAARDIAGSAAGFMLLAELGLVACLYSAAVRLRGMRMVSRQIGMDEKLPATDWKRALIPFLFGAASIYLAVSHGALHGQPTSPAANEGGFALGSVVFLCAAPWLLLERYVATLPQKALPEIDDLRPLVFLPAVLFLAQSCLYIVAGLGLHPPGWLHAVFAMVACLIAIELCVREAATWFQPPVSKALTRAPIGSLLARMLGGQFWLRPANVAAAIRSEFGLDFSRSWALQFVRAALLPVALVMLVFAWLLTGVTRISLNERGAYERLGEPASVLTPGLHVVLPWPFGVVRHVELGVIHEVPISYGTQATSETSVDRSTAEGDAPASANRLWDSEQPSDVSYIIANGGQGRQSFETVSLSARVLYRVGLSDASARDVLYRLLDPGALVYSVAGRLFAHFFASQTLPNVLGESQSQIATDIQARLQTELDTLKSGVEIVSVVIEAIHPPSGAAAAYRSVQAAQIEASTSISSEQGRARATESVAQTDAHRTIGDATAVAAEAISTAQVARTNIAADDGPFRAASEPFLLERYFSDLKSALKDSSLEIIDHRLVGQDQATVDLRPVVTPRDTLPPIRSTRGDMKP